MAEQSLVTAMAALRRDEVGADCRLLVEGEEVRCGAVGDIECMSCTEDRV